MSLDNGSDNEMIAFPFLLFVSQRTANVNTEYFFSISAVGFLAVPAGWLLQHTQQCVSSALANFTSIVNSTATKTGPLLVFVSVC